MKNLRRQAAEQGFTLIELLIVIAIIGFLAAAVLVAVDPVKRIQDSRDSRRASETNAILNAILNKQVDDRAIYGGAASAPIITDAANAQVIVTSDSGIDCSLNSARPACNVATSTAANKTCVANLSDTVTGTGAASTSASSAVTGVATLFTTEVHVGDTITSASGGTGVVAAITTDTTLTLTSTPATDFSGAFTVVYANPLTPNYIASVPVDPRGAGVSVTAGYLPLGAKNSGYYVHRTPGNRLEIGACAPEDTGSYPTINVKR